LEHTTPATCLESQRVIVRDISRDDLDQIETWRPFGDSLQRLWNIPRSSPLSRDIWFVVQGSDPTRLWYAIERRLDGRTIGTLSLREIVRPISARLGISFGADYVEQGYGSEALRVFLPHYFQALDFQRMFLDVAAANGRAVHVYEKLGFQRTGSHYRNIPDDTDVSFLQQEAYRHVRMFFRRHFGRLQLLFYDMVLERSRWAEERNAPFAAPQPRPD